MFGNLPGQTVDVEIINFCQKETELISENNICWLTENPNGLLTLSYWPIKLFSNRYGPVALEELRTSCMNVRL